MVSQDPTRNRLPNTGKRKNRHFSCPSSELPDAEAAHGSSKRIKLDHSTTPPPSFWDRLSIVPLCPSALQELNRRNEQQITNEKRDGTASDPKIRSSRRLRAKRVIEDRLRQRKQLDHSLLSPTRLRQIKRLADDGGPDLTDLRGCFARQEDLMSSSQSSLGRRKRGSQSPVKRDSSNTTTTRSARPHDRAFQQHLTDHNILLDGYEYPGGHVPPEPENIELIAEALAQPRPSLSPSQLPKATFREFKRADDHATKENKVISKVIPIIEGSVGDSKCTERDVLFANLDPLTDGTITHGKPDLYYGARPEELDRQVRRELHGHIIPSTQHDLAIAPNMFLEVKSSEGSAAVAKRRLAYDMALGARGQQTLHSYGASEPVFDKKAYTVGYRYQDGQLKVYATHMAPPSAPGREPTYIMTQVGAFAITNNIDTFCQGAAAYRNGRDWAKKERDEAIALANKVARGGAGGPGPNIGSATSATNTECTSQDADTNHESHVKYNTIMRYRVTGKA
ncbi:hypothetical protein E4U42_002805 [Claviceps africana]|uniref:Uncharacterized protein n=1 Tax=Claviceps africana TaxID=83212 RepID=A0A8K0NJB4_9HYPO|nr:hypothetical protein E4U42_002805 [Claviceps africana]